MSKKIDVKAVFNKVNGQINLSLPKKKFSKMELANLKNSKGMRISIEQFY